MESNIVKFQKLTPKQEKFCQVFIETGNASEAYRQAYDAEEMKESTVNRKAAEQFENGKITARLQALNEHHQERHDISIDTLTNQHMAIYYQHHSTSPGAAVSALKEVARLHGLCESRVRYTGDIKHNYGHTHESVSEIDAWIAKILEEDTPDDDEEPNTH